MERQNFFFTKCNLCFFIEPLFPTPHATSCAHLQTIVHSLVPTGSTNLESSPRVKHSTISIATTAMIIRASPPTCTASATKAQSISNPSRVPGNRRQNPSGMDTNRLSSLEILLIAVCGALIVVVIGLAACLCNLGKRTSTRFV